MIILIAVACVSVVVSYPEAGMNVPTSSLLAILLRLRRPHEPTVQAVPG